MYSYISWFRIGLAKIIFVYKSSLNISNAGVYQFENIWWFKIFGIWFYMKREDRTKNYLLAVTLNQVGILPYWHDELLHKVNILPKMVINSTTCVFKIMLLLQTGIYNYHFVSAKSLLIEFIEIFWSMFSKYWIDILLAKLSNSKWWIVQ